MQGVQPFEDGVSGVQNSIDDVEVATRKLLDHFGEQTLPLLREVFAADDTDGVTQLLKTKH